MWTSDDIYSLQTLELKNELTNRINLSQPPLSVVLPIQEMSVNLLDFIQCSNAVYPLLSILEKCNMKI
jgi:hypothetical protein